MATAGVDPGDSEVPGYATIPDPDEYKSTDQVLSALGDDPELAELADKFANDVSFEPDRDLNIGETDSANADSVDSLSTSSSLRDVDENEGSSPELSSAAKNGHPRRASSDQSSPTASINSSNHKLHHRLSVDSTASRDSSSALSNGKSRSSGSKKSSSGASIRNPLKALKKLTKADKSDSQKRRRSYKSEFTAVIVDKLPQLFVVKYLGHREVQGMCGLHLVRRPVDEMVKAVKEKMDGDTPAELPLLYAVISPKGVDLREHKKNKVKEVAPLGVMPIDFISYGVQDIKFWRVFCLIEVKELSSRSPKSAICHAFLCDSSHSGRKMALSIGAAFGVHAKKLKSSGKAHNFQVELRPPDELADALEDVDV